MFFLNPKMKILFFSRAEICRSASEVEALVQSAERFGFDWAVNRELAECIFRFTGQTLPESKIYGSSIGKQPQESIMVCYGGDGTLLEGIHRLDGASIAVTGINSGHLGFLSTASKEQTDEIFGRISCGELRTQQRTMLAIEGLVPDTTLHALNEVAVQSLGATMIRTRVSIDGRHVATCDGSGIIIATPTGSTAYSLSAGGPVVEPSCRCMIISPLAPHNLTMRPVVIPDTSVISLETVARNRQATISADNRTFTLDEGGSVTIRLSERSVFLAVPHNNSFYDTLRDKMMWGMEIRK